MVNCRLLFLRGERDTIMSEDEDTTLSEQSDRICQNYQIHFKIIKLFAILLMLYTATTLVGVFAFASVGSDSQAIDCNTKIFAIPAENRTECTNFHKFPLTGEVYAIVCLTGDEVKVEINKFEHGKPGIVALRMNKRQWLYLKRSVRYIDLSILQLEKIRSGNINGSINSYHRNLTDIRSL